MVARQKQLLFNQIGHGRFARARQAGKPQYCGFLPLLFRPLQLGYMQSLAMEVLSPSQGEGEHARRNRGIGQEIVRKVLQDIPHRDNIYLHSQIQACTLYERFGFVSEGPQFEEANIMHYKMVLRL